MNDVVQTIIRPAAGAVLFAANTGVIRDLDPTVSLVIGLVMALGVHGVKAAARPAVNLTTMGVGAPIISFIEDVIAAVAALGLSSHPSSLCCSRCWLSTWWCACCGAFAGAIKPKQW